MNNIKEKITEVVIDRKCNENVFSIVGLNMLQPLVKSMGIKLELDEKYWETNWWWSFEHDDLPFVLSGGLFSNHITIALDTDKLDNENDK